MDINGLNGQLLKGSGRRQIPGKVLSALSLALFAARRLFLSALLYCLVKKGALSNWQGS